MAKANATSAERTITLELTEREAEAMRAVFNSVGGSPERRRGLISNIIKALIMVDVKLNTGNISGNIYLDETKNLG